MALIEIEYGALASSEVMNTNFNYLDKQISDVSENLIMSIASVNSNIASVNSSFSTLCESLDKQIEENKKSIDEQSNIITTSGLYIETYINGTSWYREYFSDKEKKNRVWLEQGGYTTVKTVTYTKPMSDTNYTLVNAMYRKGYSDRDYSIKSFTETGFERDMDSGEYCWWRVSGV